jgi:tRNA-specific 2-thiouridylase
MKHSQKTVVLGLSGGVDSAVAALLLKKQGYNVVAAFMKNFSDSKNPLTNECSWRQELRDAQKIASILNIQLHIFDFEKEYKTQVIDPMYKAYSKGLTPNPDIACNNIIKFPLFWKHAKKLGADYIAMGHYSGIKKDSKGFHLLQGKDKSKDQSYFLAGLTQKDLSHTIFPLEKMTKEKVRKIAEKNLFPNYNKQSTRGICFVGKTNMQHFLQKKIAKHEGIVKDPSGKIIGKVD